MTCRICQSYTSEVVSSIYRLPQGLCLACGAGYLDGFNAGHEATVRDFWRGVCAQRAADLDERAETIHREALRACQAGDPSGDGPRGGRGIGGGQTTRAFYLRCDAKQLRAWAGET